MKTPRYILLALGNGPVAGALRPYKGLERATPGNLVEDEAGRAILERSYSEMCEDDSWAAYFASRESACRYCVEYAAVGIACECVEIREIEDGDVRLAISDECWLGLDIANTSRESALSPHRSGRDREEGRAPAVTLPLWQLLSEYVLPRLNEHGLLTDLRDARVVANAVRCLGQFDGTSEYLDGLRVLSLTRVSCLT